jgi:hypothetical protein
MPLLAIKTSEGIDMQEVAVKAFNPGFHIESYYAALEFDKDNYPFPRRRAGNFCTNTSGARAVLGVH